MENITITKKLIILGTAVAIGIAAPLYFCTNNKNKKSSSLSLVQKQRDTSTGQTDLKEFLEALEKNAWQHLTQAGADKKLIDQKIEREKKSEHTVKKQVDSLSTAMKEFVHGVLRDFDVNPNSVVLVNTTQAHPAWTHKRTIYINEPEMRKLASHSQKWLLAHELQHLITQDSIAREILKTTTRLEGRTADCPLNELSRFHELRADINSASKNSDYARGYHACIQELLDAKVKNTGTTHPKLEQRLALSNQILASFGINHA
jgi:hypothetical protein